MKRAWFLLAPVMSVILLASTVFPDQGFFQLVADATPQRVHDAIRNGADLSACDARGRTPLMLAAADNPDPAVITTLLRAGAKVNEEDFRGMTALLHAAARNENPSVLTTLLRAGASLDAPDSDGLTAFLHAAMSNPNPSVITVLARAGADIRARDGAGRTALMIAAAHNPVPGIISTLLERGGDPRERDAAGATPLLFAARSNPNPAVMETLIRAGACLGCRDARGADLLMYAAGGNTNGEVIQLILSLGFRWEAADEEGSTAADYAKRNPGWLLPRDSRQYRGLRKVMGGFFTFMASEAGSGEKGFAGDGGPARSALLNEPRGIAVDGAGGFYVADCGNARVRHVDARGNITTVAGNGRRGHGGDGGPASEAELDEPTGVAVDAAGCLYVTDCGGNRVRKVDADGVITTVAGNGDYGFIGDGGQALKASFRRPAGVAVDAAGCVYIADCGSNRVRKVDCNGIITTVAGNDGARDAGDGSPATSASLRSPLGVAVDSQGNLYVSESVGNRLRRVDASGIITTIAGGARPGAAGSPDAAATAAIDGPGGLAVDASGAVFFIDRRNNRVRRIDANGIITTVAGSGEHGRGGDGGPSLLAMLDDPGWVAVDSSGVLFVTDRGNSRVCSVRR